MQLMAGKCLWPHPPSPGSSTVLSHTRGVRALSHRRAAYHSLDCTTTIWKWCTPFSNAICFSSGPDWHLGPGKRTEMNEKTKRVWCLGTSSCDLTNIITPPRDSEVARQAKVSAGYAVSSPRVPQDMHSCAHTLQMRNRGDFKIQ